MYQDENYLMHYGIKGMKWGVRRFQNYDGTRIKKAGSAAKKYVSKKTYNSERSAYKRSKSMSNEELKAANKRYQLEQQYRQNVRTDVRDSRSYVRKQLNKSGGILVSAAIGAAAGGAGAMIGKRILSEASTMDIGALIAWLGAR